MRSAPMGSRVASVPEPAMAGTFRAPAHPMIGHPGRARDHARNGWARHDPGQAR